MSIALIGSLVILLPLLFAGFSIFFSSCFIRRRAIELDALSYLYIGCLYNVVLKVTAFSFGYMQEHLVLF